MGKGFIARKGCIKLADISERIVIAFTEVGSDDSTRLTVHVNRAYRVRTLLSVTSKSHRFVQIARQGRYNEALSLLLEPTVWRGLTLMDYNLWAFEVWSILVLRAIRRCVSGHAFYVSGN